MRRGAYISPARSSISDISLFTFLMWIHGITRSPHTLYYIPLYTAAAAKGARAAKGLAQKRERERGGEVALSRVITDH